MIQRKNISEPMTLDVLVTPFIENFDVVPSDTTQQWYYVNDSSFLPDRGTTPLLLTPVLSVQDPDTNKVYSPSFYQVKWYQLNASTGEYDIALDDTSEAEDVYFIVQTSGALLVKKNVLPESPVDILCDLTYIDPRNAGVTWHVTKRVSLTTNKDVAVQQPVVEINFGKTVHFDVLADDANSRYTFEATVKLGSADITDSSVIRWYATDANITAETLIDELDGTIPKFPSYVSGQGTKTLVVDAMYTDRLTVIARVYDSDNGVLYPTACYRTLTWKAAEVSAVTISDECSDVRETTGDKVVYNIVNTKTRTLTQAEVSENFSQAFYLRKATKGTSGTDTPVLVGTGSSAVLSAATMKSNVSSLAYSELTQKGCYRVVTQDGKPVIQDGKLVVERI